MKGVSKVVLALGVCWLGCGKPTEYQNVLWSELGGWAYQPSITPRQQTPRPVRLPDKIGRLNGQALRLEGYMLPVEMEGSSVRTFILARDQQACCFGRMPAMNEWVFVTTRPLDMNMDEPIQVEGRFEVGEEIEEGAVISLYRMAADNVKLCGRKPKGWKAN